MAGTKKRLHIAIALIGYENLTGVEMYTYELSRQLTLMGHEVMITAPHVGGEIKDRTEANGVKVYPFDKCPLDWEPDVLHLNELLPSCFALSRWPNVPAIATVHSQYPVEEPFLSRRIQTYVCIRPEVQQAITHYYGIDKKRTRVIYNGVDFQRFHKKSARLPTRRKVLFVGTIDVLRRQAIKRLIQEASKEGFGVRIVGQRYADYLDNPPSYVEVLAPTWNVERHLEDVSETAGILLGRTTIEGWVSGRPGWIFDVDLEGNIKSFKLHPPPEDLSKFDIVRVAKDIEAEYISCLQNRAKLVNGQILQEDLAQITQRMVSKATLLGMTVYELGLAKDRQAISHEAQGQQLERLQIRVEEIARQQQVNEQRLNRIFNSSLVRVLRSLKAKLRG